MERVLPYGFRRLTLHRVRDASWSPREERLLVPRAFGIGWSVNLARLARIGRPRAQNRHRGARHVA